VSAARRKRREHDADFGAARKTLLRLLERGEKAWAAGQDAVASLPMTPARCPEYCDLRSLHDIETYEAEIDLAVRVGAIATERERFAGEHPRLERLRLLDLDRLGAHLGVTTLAAQYAEARALLADRATRHPVLAEVLAAWRRGDKVRGSGPAGAVDLADAVDAMDRRRDDNVHERLLRRESVRLFKDSKRLEKLTGWLDLLLTGELAPSGLDEAHVWSALGLRREPLPLLIAGRGVLRIGDDTIPLCRPYLGAPTDAVSAIDSPARVLLTIENLTSFHDAARACRDDRVLLLYTGGMPSPAWRAAYARLLASLPAGIALYHWGDIDEGGFRIAAVIAHAARDAGHALHPWRMSPEEIPRTLHGAPPSSAVLRNMLRSANQTGWSSVVDALQRTPLTLEQEALDPEVPTPA
jgi:hypothetical protein